MQPEPRCKNCEKKVVSDLMLGNCTNCGNNTSSSAIKLCSDCAKEQNKCAICLKRL